MGLEFVVVVMVVVVVVIGAEFVVVVAVMVLEFGEPLSIVFYMGREFGDLEIAWAGKAKGCCSVGRSTVGRGK